LVWNSIKDTDDPAMFRGYLKQYPSGIFAAIAKEKVQSSERVKVAREEDERQQRQERARLEEELEAAKVKATADAQAAARQELSKVLAEERKRAAEALKATTDAELKRIREGVKIAALNPNASLRTSIQGDWDLKISADGGTDNACGFDHKMAQLSIRENKYTFRFKDMQEKTVEITGDFENQTEISEWTSMTVQNLRGYQTTGPRINDTKIKLSLNIEGITGSIMSNVINEACTARIYEKGIRY